LFSSGTTYSFWVVGALVIVLASSPRAGGKQVATPCGMLDVSLCGHGGVQAPGSRVAATMPLGRLEYLYMGSADVAQDLAYYRDVMGAEVVWDVSEFGTRVAGVRLFAQGPMVLIAGHRRSPSLLPVFAVDDLDAVEKDLRKKGWAPEGGRFGIPDGDCYLFKDPTGNEMAIYEDSRPHVLERDH
jgi:predicted enzyme related to lactoylglutathione lyase